MASLVKYCRFASKVTRPLLNVRPQNTIPAASAGNWNKDWAAGPTPLTKEEKAAAAKKYGLREEDYEPYPHDGFGWGDYPKLPYVSGDSRDPYYDWDMPELKRNFNEPMHIESDIIGEDRWNPNMDYRFTLLQQLRWLLIVLGGFTGAYLLLMPYPIFTPMMPKQMPYEINSNGEYVRKTHYVFEPVE